MSESNRAIKNNKKLKILINAHIKTPMVGLDSLWHDATEHIPCCRSTVHHIMKENWDQVET